MNVAKGLLEILVRILWALVINANNTLNKFHSYLFLQFNYLLGIFWYFIKSNIVVDNYFLGSIFI